MDLQNSISVSKSSLQSLETLIPPKYIMKEHQLLVESIKGLVDALEYLLRSIELKMVLTIKEVDLEKEIINLKKIEKKVNVASEEVVRKIMVKRMNLNG
ncbi:hypothetical protein [Bacillus sp. FSL K6-3431]|uniref:hypothetical protein n=1 Tax=Bacillus sp. FSL K6-3431 TaxID=2921500 RepID=UPI0030F4F490